MFKLTTRFILLFVFIHNISFFAIAQQPAQVATVAPGVKKRTSGQPEKFSPYSFCNEKPMAAEMSRLPEAKLPFNVYDIKINVSDRGVLVEIPLDNEEELYGFGLQMGSFNQKGLRKKPVLNDNPSHDLGYSHTPMLFEQGLWHSGEYFSLHHFLLWQYR